MNESILAEIREIIKNYIANKESSFIPGKSRIDVGAPIFDENEIISVLGSLLQTKISQGKAVSHFE